MIVTNCYQGVLRPLTGVTSAGAITEAHDALVAAASLPTYTYLRLSVSSGFGSGGSQLVIYEIEARESPTGSNFLSGATATASSEASGTNTAAKAIDHSYTTQWKNVSGDYPCTWTAQFSPARFPNIISFAVNPTGPSAFSVQASNDGTTWTTLRTFSAGEYYINQAGTALGTRHVALPGSVLLRAFVSAVHGGATSMQCKEFRIYSDMDKTTQIITGGLAAAQSASSGVYPQYAYDEDGGTFWSNDAVYNPVNGGGTWLGYILPNGTIPTASDIKRVMFSCVQQSVSPVDFKIQVSTDGGQNWTTLADPVGSGRTVNASTSGYVDVAFGSYTVNNTHTKFLTHAEGTDGSTTMTDELGHAFTVSGTATISTTRSKAGSSSLLLPNGNDSGWVSNNYETAFALSTATPFTLEMWVYCTGYPSGNSYLFELKTSTTTLAKLQCSSAGSLTGSAFGVVISPSPAWTLPLNQWNHVAFCLDQYAEVWMCLNGAAYMVTGAFSGSGNCKLSIGRPVASGASFNGWIDEVRFLNGQCLYDGNYIIPSTPYSYP